MVLNLEWKQIILGMPWLWKWNPQVDWIANTLILKSLQIRNAVPLCECLPSMNDSTIPQRYLHHWLGLDANQKILNRLWKREQWLAGEMIGKITISTQIVQNTHHDEVTLPSWCAKFEDVFSERTHNKLPPHWSYNHTIDLQPMFTPKIAKVYSLNSQEMETCKAFIKEHLETGHIIPSKSPQASPFFFIPKKDGTLHPCQDYCYLNSHTVWNAYPLSLIPELIDNMKASTIFTKFDIWWGYNNICLQEENQWKAAFITPMGLFKPTIMFFGCCNAPSTFQVLMNHIFTDILTGKWLKISVSKSSCQLSSLPKIKKTGCGPVATSPFEDWSLGPWSPHSGAYTQFFSYFYLFIWIY